MAWALNDEDFTTKYGTGDSVLPAIAVTTGDLIVICYTGLNSGSAVPVMNSITDTAGNSYTFGSIYYGNYLQGQFAYCIGATGHANNIITVSYGDDEAARKNVNGSSWTPDGGETVTLDVTEGELGGWEASPWETAGLISTTGTDELCIALVQGGGSITLSNEEIPSGTAADGTLTATALGTMSYWYRILSSTESGIEAEVDPSGSAHHVIALICFKSESAGEALIRSVSETLNLTEVNKKIRSFFKLISETLNLIEVNKKIRSFFKLISETLNLTEVSKRLKSFFKLISETLNLTEVVFKVGAILLKKISEILKLLEIRRDPFDTILILPGVFRKITFKRFFSETLNLTESVLKSGLEVIKKIIETLNLIEVTKKSVGFFRKILDTLNLIDLNLNKVFLKKIIDEILSLSEVVIRKISIKRIISIVLELSAQNKRMRGLKRIILDTLVSSEVVKRTRALKRILFDILILLEINKITRILKKIISDNINLIEGLITDIAIALLIEIKVIRRVFTFDNSKRVFTFDNLKRVFTKITERRIF